MLLVWYHTHSAPVVRSHLHWNLTTAYQQQQQQQQQRQRRQHVTQLCPDGVPFVAGSEATDAPETPCVGRVGAPGLGQASTPEPPVLPR